MASALVCGPELADGGQPKAMPERPELPRRAPSSGVICQEEVCAAGRRRFACDGCPCLCEPVPHPCCEGAGDEDVGEGGNLASAVAMRAAVLCRICAADVAREASDKELAVKECPCRDALVAVQVCSPHMCPGCCWPRCNGYVDLVRRWFLWLCEGAACRGAGSMRSRRGAGRVRGALIHIA
jgi:hypothetical protein